MYRKTWFECDPVAMGVLILSMGVVLLAFIIP
jgi:hypothetical protein